MPLTMSRGGRARRTIDASVDGAGGVVINGAGRGGGGGGRPAPPGGGRLPQHRNGTWVFPKGHVEAGESKVDAAVREVEEEAGVQAAVVDRRQTWQTQYVNPRRQMRRITWYLLRSEATEPVLREQIFPVGGFFPPAEASSLLSFEEDRALLRAVLRAARRHGLVHENGTKEGNHLGDARR
jgi:diadenosine hexaphosphate hydrolase (ATP-forming)